MKAAIVLVIAWVIVFAVLTPVAKAAGPTVKIACGGIVEMHVHGRVGRIGTAYHVWISDDSTRTVYTCSVPRARYDEIRGFRNVKRCCWGLRGQS
jgi:hypothetical protein